MATSQEGAQALEFGLDLSCLSLGLGFLLALFQDGVLLLLEASPHCDCKFTRMSLPMISHKTAPSGMIHSELARALSSGNRVSLPSLPEILR